jgi:hypothetical protein
MKRRAWVLIAALILWSDVSLAIEFPANARLFIGVSNADPANLNQEMKAQGLQEFSKIPKFGVEIAYPLLQFLEVGLSYTKRWMQKDETDSNLLTNYQATLSQDTLYFIARVPFVKSDFFRADVFAGVGGNNTTLTMKSASQDGELSKREASDWFASFATTYGASVAVGYKNFFVTFEGGVESNKVDSFKRTGNINNNIQSIDLSGSYATIGLMFNGVTAHSK